MTKCRTRYEKPGVCEPTMAPQVRLLRQTAIPCPAGWKPSHVASLRPNRPTPSQLTLDHEAFMVKPHQTKPAHSEL